MLSRWFIVVVVMSVAIAIDPQIALVKQHEDLDDFRRNAMASIAQANAADEQKHDQRLALEAHAFGNEAQVAANEVPRDNDLEAALNSPPKRPSTTNVFLTALSSLCVWLMLVLITVKCCYPVGYVPMGEAPYTPQIVLEIGHFWCFNDCQVFIWSLFCPVIRWADTLEQASMLTFWTGVALFSGTFFLNVVPYFQGWTTTILLFLILFYRQELRKKLKLQPWQCPQLCTDCLFVCFCPCLAIAQEAYVARAAIQSHTDGFATAPPQDTMMNP